MEAPTGASWVLPSVTSSKGHSVYFTVQAVSFKKSLSLSQSITLAPPEILALKKVNAFHVTHAQTMHRRIDKKGEPFLILMAYFQN